MKFIQKLGDFILKLADWYGRYCAWVWRTMPKESAPKHFVESPRQVKVSRKASKTKFQNHNFQGRGRIYPSLYRKVDARPSPLPYHLEKGWQKSGRVYQGYYRCRLAACKGQIEERFNGDYKFFIFNPPQEVLSGSHSACFTDAGGGRYHVHFGVDGRSLDAGIMAVERILYQNLNRR